jgi:hypothetical protein
MKENKIKFTIPKGGGISFEVVDGQGTSCTLVTKDIELQLSSQGTIVRDEKKPEYYNDGPSLDVFNSISS